MKRKRSAETGRYISNEEAKTLDSSTWIEQEEFDKVAFLEDIYDLLFLKSFLTIHSLQVVSLEDIKLLFSKYKTK